MKVNSIVGWTGHFDVEGKPMTPTPTAEERARQMEALAARLAQPILNEDTLQRWDYVRSQIAAGSTSSHPRDVFESVLDALDQDRAEAAVIVRQAAEAARAVPVAWRRAWNADGTPAPSTPLYAHPVPASAGVAEGLLAAAKEWEAARTAVSRLGAQSRPEDWTRLGAAETALSEAVRALNGTSHG